jgi:hypothetical protein
MKFIAKKDNEGNLPWFDEGTECMLIDDYRKAEKSPWPCGLFSGLRNGKYDEEICTFDEFEEIESKDD